jgi:hypothetical protein
MSTADNYRSSLDYREILRILQKASSGEDNFLWQTHAHGRNIIPIHHFEIDFVAREVVVHFDDKDHVIDAALPLYVKVEYRTTVFKVDRYRFNQNVVHFSFPTKVKTLELRSFPRHQFTAKEDKVIYLKPSLGGSRDSGNELKVKVLDISIYGLGLLISEQNRGFFKNNPVLWITRLGEVILDHPVLAEVAYINLEVESRYQLRKKRELKVGLKVSGVFPKAIYQDFIK